MLKVQKDHTNHQVQDGKQISLHFLTAIKQKRLPRGLRVSEEAEAA